MTVDNLWWSSLRHGGLLIAPSRLALLRKIGPEPISESVVRRLRADLTRLTTDTQEARKVFLDTVFQNVCGLGADDSAEWRKGNEVPATWSRRGAAGDTLKPRRIWLGPGGGVLPVFVDEEKRLGAGRGRRMVSRVLEWLRATDLKVAVLTNHTQFRLVYAGADYDAWAEWETTLWFEEGQPSPQVQALRWLLAPETLTPPQPGGRSPLLDAIEETRKGQAELSATLGERVRLAVEALIQSYGEQLATLPASVEKRHIYIAATRIVMRMVVVLFAEARELLPRDNPRYETSYGLQGLRASLERVSGGARARRNLYHGAWARVLGLFGLVFYGSHHPEMLIRRYGGGLFTPGAANSEDPIARALAILEDPEHGPHDNDVAKMLDFLCRTEAFVQVGTRKQRVMVPVDFSDLSSEYIGILYEGLLDYELRQAKAEQPLVFLAVGDQPVLPLSRLQGMGDEQIAGLVEKMKKSRAAVSLESEDADEDEDAAENDSEDECAAQVDAEPVVELVEAVADDVDALAATDAEPEAEDEPAPADDAALAVAGAAHEWAMRAVRAGGLVRKPRGRSAVALAAYQEQVAATARTLILRIVMPGEWFLVLWGGTRKGSGTFYTPPQLAVPTVQRTLRELAFDMPAAGEDAPLSEWSPKTPDAILSLKVCDPSVGSGSFAVAALRFLTDALWRSLLHHRWLVEDERGFHVQATGAEPPPWFSECVQDLPVIAGDAEVHVRARLRRLVVERCIYGVDLDPLAIELARLSLWVETMNRDLPFEFLDHRLKVGNSLVGCWFDRFRDYPAMAWMREGGDATFENFVNHYRLKQVMSGKAKGTEQKAGDKWTTAIKQWRDDHVKPELANWIVGQGSLLREIDGRAPETLHDEAVDLLRQMEAIPLHEPDERARFYREVVQVHPAFQRLVTAFDTWCALWFWPADNLISAPMPAEFGRHDANTLAVVRRLKQTHRFFHWELEFADVFAAQGSGFDAIVGNPPWEIQKPNSKEFFSNIDPLYRTYGKQDALAKQEDYFRTQPAHELEWVAYVARYKALSNWNKHAATPFGDPADGGESWALERGQSTIHVRWRERRSGRTGYADPSHPFQHQGPSDINTYKMFLEQSHGLLRLGGRLALITPAALYGDKGALSLRKLFLTTSKLTDLYAFQNEKRVFPEIHHAYKMCVVFVQKGGSTFQFRTLFNIGVAHSPTAAQAEEQLMRFSGALSVSREQLERFSPTSRSLMEVRSTIELDVLDALFRRAVFLGDKRPDGWSVDYLCEFHMTNDSGLFPPRPKWEGLGYSVDDYGNWVGPSGDIALPVYEGRMVGQFDFQRKGWVSGKGRRAVWREIPWPKKRFAPQFLMSEQHYASAVDERSRWKVAFMDVAASNVERTMISTLLYGVPCGNSAPTLTVNNGDLVASGALMAVLNSFAYDFVARRRCTGLHLNWFLVAETPLPPFEPNSTWEAISVCASALALPHMRFAPGHLYLRAKLPHHFVGRSWRSWWALTRAERLRQRCILDALVAYVYQLSFDEFKIILAETDYPAQSLAQREFSSAIDSKAFWLVDHQDPPELRHSVLALVAFRELQRVGVEAFAGLDGGDGWALPEALCLAEYGLGHDDRAKCPQPVASHLGDRFLPGQTSMSIEQSWAECERHARNLLGADGYARLQAEIARDMSGAVPAPAPMASPAGAAQRRLFSGEPSLFSDGTEDLQ